MFEFDRYVINEETATVTVDGFEVTATVYDDDNADAPWDSEDGHGPVTDWTRRPKASGEWILSEDHGSHRFYDFAAAVKIARRDGWGAPGDEGMKPVEKAAHAALADFKALKAWCNDDWRYVGIAVTVSRNGVTLTGQYDHAVWGIEANSGSDNSHLGEVAADLMPDALAEARAKLAELAS